MWGMVSFLVAFCFMCFQGSDVSTRVLVTSLCAIVSIPVAWCAWNKYFVVKGEVDKSSFEPKPDPNDNDSGQRNRGSKPTISAGVFTPLFRVDISGTTCQPKQRRRASQEAKATIIGKLWRLPTFFWTKPQSEISDEKVSAV
ncbi:hypothetical protein BDZ97DRAFT_1320403 [Flammula alnicola]|nr:hypothetical protein BDZ97DRAFT_1320403 [Flammula alnicola]